MLLRNDNKRRIRKELKSLSSKKLWCCLAHVEHQNKDKRDKTEFPHPYVQLLHNNLVVSHTCIHKQRYDTSQVNCGMSQVNMALFHQFLQNDHLGKVEF